MTTTKIELPEMDCSPQDYVNQRLVPAVSQLQSLINELFQPKMTAEASNVDMVPHTPTRDFQDVNKIVAPDYVKTIALDPSQAINDHMAKYKVMFEGVFYLQGEGHTAEFRLACEKENIKFSTISVDSREPKYYSVLLDLPRSDQFGMIKNHAAIYRVQARYLGRYCFPICRTAKLTIIKCS